MFHALVSMCMLFFLLLHILFFFQLLSSSNKKKSSSVCGVSVSVSVSVCVCADEHHKNNIQMKREIVRTEQQLIKRHEPCLLS